MDTKLFPLVILSLKRILRKKKITYSQLSRRIRMSESGLKKLFTNKDISFRRLTQICEVLGLPLIDLLKEIEQSEAFYYSFTSDQESYFIRNPQAFKIFWKLVYERHTPNIIQAHYNLTHREVATALQQLAKLKLIVYTDTKKVKIPRVRAITWQRNSPFTKKILRDWSQKLLNDQLINDPLGKGLLQLRYFCFQKHIYDDLLFKLRNLENDFLQNTVRDMNLQDPKDLIQVSWLSAVRPAGFVE